MYWCDTVTVYHRSMDESGKISWDSKQYMNCFWQERSGASPNSGVTIKNATRLARLPATAVVSAGDVAVFGAVSDTIDEYTQGKRLTDFRKQHSKSFVVASVHDNTGAGRPIPHIYIEGA